MLVKLIQASWILYSRSAGEMGEANVPAPAKPWYPHQCWLASWPSHHLFASPIWPAVCGSDFPTFKKNKCGDNRFLCSSVSKVPEKSDYIFANILLNPLKKMSKSILKKLKKGGRVYLSGILIGQVSELLASYKNASDGMIVKVSEKKLKQWVCVELSFK